MYATLTDLQMRFGQPNLNKWANAEGDNSLTTSRINAALQFADDEINSKLNGKWYQTPLVFQDQTAARRVTEWACVIAGYWLYFNQGLLSTDDQGKALDTRYKAIQDELLKIANGTMTLNGNPRWAPNPREPACI